MLNNQNDNNVDGIKAAFDDDTNKKLDDILKKIDTLFAVLGNAGGGGFAGR